MSWNGSNPNEVRPVKQRNCSRHGRLLVTISATVVAAIFVFVCVFYITSNSETDQTQLKHFTKSNEANDSIKSIGESASKIETAISNQDVVKVGKEPSNTYRDERGVLRYVGGARVPRPGEFDNPTKIINNSSIPKFEHRVEREIAALITCRPGSIIAGNPRYDGIEQDFANSLVDKIEFSSDDTPRQREIKQAVIDVKQELAQRIKQGEKLVDILKDTRGELRRMADYKYEIEKVTNEQLRNSAYTEEDIELAYEAANTLLEKKGIAPIQMNNILKRREMILHKLNNIEHIGH